VKEPERGIQLKLAFQEQKIREAEKAEEEELKKS